MSRLKAIGVTWVVVAAFSVAMTLAFRVEPTQVLVTLGLAFATAVLGIWMLRSSSATGGPSLGFAIAWLVVYVGLAMLQSDDIGAWVTDTGLALAGIAVGLVAWKSATGVSARGEAKRGPATLG